MVEKLKIEEQGDAPNTTGLDTDNALSASKDDLRSNDDDDESTISDNEDDADADPSHSPPAASGRASFMKRFVLLSVLLLCLWLFLTSKKESTKPKVVYASRYSKEHKFRPAASPVITETLKDGRIRLRGANPTTHPTPTPTSPTKKKRKSKSKRGSKKHAAKKP